MAAARDDDRTAPERTCVATRTARPAHELIRFVRAPDGTVVPDLKRELPGRGVWVSASEQAVSLAVKRKAFARGFKEAATTVDPALAERTGELIERGALGMFGFVNKAGLVVTGFAKVEAALASEPVVALVEASDAGEDGVRKLGQAVRRAGREGVVKVVRLFRSGQLDLALGRSNVVHAALLAGSVSAAFLARCDALARYKSAGADGTEPGVKLRAADGQMARADEPAGTDRA